MIFLKRKEQLTKQYLMKKNKISLKCFGINISLKRDLTFEIRKCIVHVHLTLLFLHCKFEFELK